MQFPQRELPQGRVRAVLTTDVEALAAAQPKKNRRYLQLGEGELRAEMVDVHLESTQIFRERMDTAMRVEAAPDPGLVPFAVVRSSEPIRFCGERLSGAALAQATGGAWDVRFDGPLDYVAWVFERGAFEQGVARLRGRAPEPGWFVSRARPAPAVPLAHLGAGIVRLLDCFRARPGVLEEPGVRRLVEASLLRLTVAVLTAGEAPPSLPAHERRRRAVHRALELVAAYPRRVHTLPELCAVAGVSERTLEYGFREEIGVTPRRYLKLVRLNGTRGDLLRASPAAARVTDIALRWGFVEMGRFAGEYRRLFGELPSRTLRDTERA